MYNLLIVDDEIYAVEGVKSGVSWSSLGFSNVYEAYHMEQAKEIFLQFPIDVVICDIEMPAGNGLELLEWIRVHYPAVETIFLTCHTDFEYAKRALQLGSHDYLLKPVDYRVLEKTIREIVELIDQEKEWNMVREKYNTFLKDKKSMLVERFWQDILGGRSSATPEHIRKSLQEFTIEFDFDTMEVLPILISIEQWSQVFTERDEEILEYAIRNAAEEIFLEDVTGNVIKDRNGINMILIYYNKKYHPKMGQLASRCEAFIQATQRYFYCKTSCYMGIKTNLNQLKLIYEALLKMEYNNVTKSHTVYHYQLKETSDRTFPAIDLSEWSDLIMDGNDQELHRRIDKSVAILKSNGANAEMLHLFYHSVLQTIYTVLQKKGKHVQDVFGSIDFLGPAAIPKTMDQLKKWALDVTEVVVRCLKADQNSVVHRIKGYIQDHLDAEIGRDDLAKFVHLNPAYLSRLFKKETSESLSEYILKQKMNLAKELLRNTNKPISEISHAVGYSSFSYFTKTFKKFWKINPQAFRKHN